MTCPLLREARKFFKYVKLIHETIGFFFFFLIVRIANYTYSYLFFKPKNLHRPLTGGNCLGCLLGSAGHDIRRSTNTVQDYESLRGRLTSYSTVPRWNQLATN